MNWEYKEALNSYKPTLEEHLALKKLKPTLNTLIQYADDFYITEVGVRTLGRDLNKRPNTISSHLKELEELGFIEVLDKKGKFGKCNMKRLTLPNVSNNVTVNVSPNVSVNVSDNVSDNVSPMTDTEGKGSKEKRSSLSSLGSEDAIEVSNYLLDSILKIKPNFKKPNIQSWAKDIDKAIRIDDRTKDEMINAIDWIFSKDGEFWQSNILSAGKLRKQFDTLEAQAMRGN